VKPRHGASCAELEKVFDKKAIVPPTHQAYQTWSEPEEADGQHRSTTRAASSRNRSEGRGRIRAVCSLWANSSYRYAQTGDLSRIETRRGGKAARAELAGGRVRKRVDFLKLDHSYDSQGRQTSVAVGDEQVIHLAYDQ
jgi:hypothetical protein